MSYKVKVVYDSQVFDVQTYGGISRYFCEIMQKLHVPHEVALKYSHNYYLNHYRLCAAPSRFLPGFMRRKLWEKSQEENRRRCLAKLDGSEEFVFHPTYYDPYFLEHLCGRPYVVTVHDMIYERFPDLPDADAVIEQKRKTICGASHVIAISEYTKKDVMELLHVPEEKISVVYHGTNLKPNARIGTKIDFPYLLYVGDRSAGYKNWHRMLQAFAQLHRENACLHLICTGKPFSNDDKTLINSLLHTSAVDDFVHAVSASENVLSDLYGQALAFVYPSLYEGFGIPILEAYACGCPVVLSRATCFPEIAREAGCYFNPMDVDDMVRSIRQVIYNPSERKRLIATGTERLQYFSWEKAARETEEVYRKVSITE